MKTTIFTTFALTTLLSTLSAAEYHVALTGADANSGTRKAPFRTIQHAAEVAQPGDAITVHAGVYRERVNPPRGGKSDRERIVYQAARGEKVEVKGSELVKDWVKVQEGVWKVVLPQAFFGGFNPYSDLIRGDWFDPRGREHHTGAVYLNGEWLTEAAKLDEVLAPGAAGSARPLWFARVEDATTTIWAQFKDADPTEQTVEINVRRTVFYPEKTGCDFITVRGFTLRDAATPWAPPTAEQIGVIGTHWSRGWIIESNLVSHSTCSGIALGKYGDQWDNTSANSAEGYVLTINRALANGWNRETIGHHIVRYNTVCDCEQAGIVGSLGAAFCSVTDNDIHDIHVRRLFSGAEMAGIKFHAAIDTVIRGNHIYCTCRGLWLDWMAQGTRVAGNLFHDNAGEDLFLEVDHGPFVVDNNLFLSPLNVRDMSEGGTFAHNLFAGKLASRPEPNRKTPYHPALTIKGGDHRFLNNLFIGPGGEAGRQPRPAKDPGWAGGFGLWVYDYREFPLQTGGNVFYDGALPYGKEIGAALPAAEITRPALGVEGHDYFLRPVPAAELKPAATVLVTTAMLGKARVPGLGYENADGSALSLDADYFGKSRSRSHPLAGPFEKPATAPKGRGDWPGVRVW